MPTSIKLKRDELSSNFSGAKHYDLVIIGSGITGLSSGLMWQKNTSNKKTLIVEKNVYPGGYSTAYERNEYVFETTQLFPATYARYSGSPTGSLYDMASLVTQFGPKRLPMETPIRNLLQPKFSHGLYGTMMNGVQVVDLMLDRKFNNGNSLFNPNR